MGDEAEGAQTQLSPRNHFGFKPTFAEKNSLACLHFAARADKRFPGIGSELPRQEDFYRRSEMFPARGT
jgi:hypothetical protein